MPIMSKTETCECKRIYSLDYVKGSAIFLVVWLHVIQYLCGQTFENHLFTKVCSFHMPVFMIISGFLFYPKIKDTRAKFDWDDLISVIRKQFCRLILPNCYWGGVILLFSIKETSLHDIFNIPNSCWFLSTLFVVSLLYYLLGIWIRSVLSIVVIVVITLWFVPGCEFLKFFAPFFGIGLLVRDWDLLKKFDRKHLYALGAVAIFLLFFWNARYAIYRTPNPTIWNCSFEMVQAYIYRIVAGTAITVVLIKSAGIIGLANNILGKILMKLSSASLGIYVIHILIFSHFAKPFFVDKNEVVTDAVSFVISISIVSVLLFVINAIRKNRIFRLIALGEK